MTGRENRLESGSLRLDQVILGYVRIFCFSVVLGLSAAHSVFAYLACLTVKQILEYGLHAFSVIRMPVRDKNLLQVAITIRQLFFQQVNII